MPKASAVTMNAAKRLATTYPVVHPETRASAPKEWCRTERVNRNPQRIAALSMTKATINTPLAVPIASHCTPALAGSQ